MDITQMKIGTKLELELNSDTEAKLGHTLVSELEWLENSNTLAIAAPIHEGVLYPLHIGTKVAVFFVVKNCQEYELYTFHAEVIIREHSGNIALLKIRLLSQLEKVQRRQYYRLGCSIPVKFRILDTMFDISQLNIQYRQTIASNLSGGGICLLLEDKIEVGKMVECEISTDEKKVIKFYGKVVRHDLSELDGKFKYEAGIVYIRINNNDREAVVKFIFNEQRKLRKRGLI